MEFPLFRLIPYSIPSKQAISKVLLQYHRKMRNKLLNGTEWLMLLLPDFASFLSAFASGSFVFASIFRFVIFGTHTQTQKLSFHPS